MVHFWEFEFVFVEVVPPLGHSVVDADVIEKDDSAEADERTVEGELNDDLFGIVVGIDEEDVDWATFADLPCECGVEGVANNEFDVVKDGQALDGIGAALDVDGYDFARGSGSEMRSAPSGAGSEFDNEDRLEFVRNVVKQIAIRITGVSSKDASVCDFK